MARTNHLGSSTPADWAKVCDLTLDHAMSSAHQFRDERIKIFVAGVATTRATASRRRDWHALSSKEMLSRISTATTSRQTASENQKLPESRLRTGPNIRNASLD